MVRGGTLPVAAHQHAAGSPSHACALQLLHQQGILAPQPRQQLQPTNRPAATHHIEHRDALARKEALVAAANNGGLRLARRAALLPGLHRVGQAVATHGCCRLPSDVGNRASERSRSSWLALKPNLHATQSGDRAARHQRLQLRAEESGMQRDQTVRTTPASA